MAWRVLYPSFIIVSALHLLSFLPGNPHDLSLCAVRNYLRDTAHINDLDCRFSARLGHDPSFNIICINKSLRGLLLHREYESSIHPFHLQIPHGAETESRACSRAAPRIWIESSTSCPTICPNNSSLKPFHTVLEITIQFWALIFLFPKIIGYLFVRSCSAFQ